MNHTRMAWQTRITIHHPEHLMTSAAPNFSSERFTGTERYVATDDLKLAVNAALALERPLLIKGEPGTGKTMQIGRAPSELQSLMRISYAVFCLKKKKHRKLKHV